jgi:L-lactate dehydrogenase
VKIAIIGTGRVGSSLAYALVLKELGDSLFLANRSVTTAQGDALDLLHAHAFCERPMRIDSGTIEQVQQRDILVITASVPLTGNMTSRLDLGENNVRLFDEIIPLLAANNPNAIFIIITNPVDVMTYYATQLSGFPANRVMGIGTLIDSARFRMSLSEVEKIHPNDLRAYILGEHGSHQFPVFSHAEAGTEQIPDTPQHRAIFQQVVEAGMDVYHLKGYTNYAIAMAACEVIRSIIYDERHTMPLSTCFSEWLGIKDNCFSIPVVVGREGIIRYLYPQLNTQEKEQLQQAAVCIQNNIQQLCEDKTTLSFRQKKDSL